MSYCMIRAVVTRTAAFTATGLTQTPARKAPASCPRNVSELAPKPAAPVTFKMNQGRFPAPVRLVSPREGLNPAVTGSRRSI